MADASDEGWKGAKQTLRSALEMMPNEEGFVSGDFLMSLAPHRLNSIIRVKELWRILNDGGSIADLLQSSAGASEATLMPGNYSGLGIKGEIGKKECRLATDYIGQSWDMPVRGVQGCMGIVEEAALKLLPAGLSLRLLSSSAALLALSWPPGTPNPPHALDPRGQARFALRDLHPQGGRFGDPPSVWPPGVQGRS